MRDGGYEEDAEGFNLQSLGHGFQTALPAAMQGAAAGSALGPWGALATGLASGAMSLMSQGSQPAAASRPAPQPARPAPMPPVQAGIAAPAPPPTMAPTPPASLAPTPSPTATAPALPPPAPAPSAIPQASPVASPAPTVAGPGGGDAAGSFGQVMALLGNPQVQQLLASFTAGQRPSAASFLGGASAALNAFAPRPGAAEAEGEAEAETDEEAASGGGPIGWLVASGVARLG
jgi:hypothetical protein